MARRGVFAVVLFFCSIYLPLIVLGTMPVATPTRVHAQGTPVIPLPSDTPAATATPIPPTLIPPRDYQSISHRIMVFAGRQYYGARARIWSGDPHLRWSSHSYAGIWLAGPRTGDIHVPGAGPTETPYP